jgi:hypothetical protein
MRRSASSIGSKVLLIGLCANLVCGVACSDELPAPGTFEQAACFGSNAEAALAEDDDFQTTWAKVGEVAAQMSGASFELCYPKADNLAGMPYDPLTADYLDVIQAEVGLSEEQLSLLANHGFVVLDDERHYSFEGAYASLYAADLPMLITSDSLLYALHRSFDRILMELESTVLEGEMQQMLDKMHAELAELDVPPQLELAVRDLDVYLTVARSLLDSYGPPQATITGGAADEQVASILQQIAAESPGVLDLFGVSASYDYSQMAPRGHYDGDLWRYFQTVMWLGRTDVPLIIYPDGELQLNRRGVEAAVIIGELLDQGGREHWDRIELILHQLLGEPDSMSPATLDKFRSDAGILDLEILVATSDEELQGKLLAGKYGVQRIMSQIISTDVGTPQVQLPQVFLLLGQRFTIDSYVMNAVTFDRLSDPQTGEKTPRMLPHELDVAFALGSDVAGELLADELDKYHYHGVLHGLRFLIDAHPESFWKESFYNGWLHAIRSLDDPSEQAEYPAAMQTDAWKRKTLNTQLASWAELRHDTIAYNKPSYSGSIGCEYPQVYVEPVPAFYARMAGVAEQGLALADVLDHQGHAVPAVLSYFEHMADVMARLESIASKQLDGLALDDDEWQFLRATIEAEKIGCASAYRYDGWYGQLLYEVEDHGDFRPTIADVHTAPTDAHGTPVGWVLHAATGHARSMVFTVEDCSGVRAYVGPVSTFYSKLTEGYERLDDDRWADELDDGAPQTPEWAHAFAD